MTLQQLFYLIGEMLHDEPKSADMPVKLEMLLDQGLAHDDPLAVRIQNGEVLITTEEL